MGRSTRRGACDFLSFGGYGLDRQPHQRSGDFSLSLLVVGDADRGKNGFIQGRRIAPDPTRTIFVIPVFAHRASPVIPTPRRPHIALQYVIGVAVQPCILTPSSFVSPEFPPFIF